MAEPSPLGRYAESADDEARHRVQLVGVPVRVLASARKHHDELMHEFSLLAVRAPDRRDGVPARLRDLVDVLGRRYGAASRRPDAVLDAALARGDRTTDLDYQVPAWVVEAADHLEALMAEADEFCRAEQMLTMPRPELQVRFAHWYLDEFHRQIKGLAPQAWDGPLGP